LDFLYPASSESVIDSTFEKVDPKTWGCRWNFVPASLEGKMQIGGGVVLPSPSAQHKRNLQHYYVAIHQVKSLQYINVSFPVVCCL